MSNDPESRTDDYAPPEPPPNQTSYAQMGISQSKWARTERSWVNILAVALLVVLCLAVNMACIVWYYGFDRLLAMLGWQ